MVPARALRRFAVTLCAAFALGVTACSPARGTAHSGVRGAGDLASRTAPNGHHGEDGDEGDDDDGSSSGATAQNDGTPARADDRDRDDGEDGDDEDGPDDAFDEEPPADAVSAPPHPFAQLSDAELEKRLRESPSSLGSMSVGKPSAGLLFNGVVMPPGDAWTVVSSAQTWGTDETVQYLQAALTAVARSIPDTPRVSIGDISSRGGGYLKPHLSHQAGRDVDVGYYYLDGEHWYARANAQNLDVRRTWALVRALVTLTDVELILIDHSLQALLRDEAEREGEDASWVNALFRGAGSVPPMIRHAPGHATHLHVRFYNPVAQETGRRCYTALLRQHKIIVGPAFLTHVARKGDTLIELAKRYGTTTRAIRRANGLKSSKIQAKKSYRIPQTGRAPPTFSSRPIAVPPRRIPPPRTSARSDGRQLGGQPASPNAKPAGSAG